MIDFSLVTVPKPTPETAHFYEGTAADELRLQQCNHVRQFISHLVLFVRTVVLAQFLSLWPAGEAGC